LNSNVIGKDNIICVLLVNATMCLNLTEEPNILHLSFALNLYNQN